MVRLHGRLMDDDNETEVHVAMKFLRKGFNNWDYLLDGVRCDG